MQVGTELTKFLTTRCRPTQENFKFRQLVTKQKMNDYRCFEFENFEIKCDDSVKLLGVTLDFRLSFDEHISNLCKKKKAFKQLNVLKRISKHVSKLCKLNIYYSFILSNFNYCHLIWHFCGETNIKKVETIQEMTLRFIYNDYVSDYDCLLLKSKLPTLKVRHLIKTFKFLNNQGPVYLFNLVNFKSNSYSFRYTKTAKISQVKNNKV